MHVPQPGQGDGADHLVQLQPRHAESGRSPGSLRHIGSVCPPCLRLRDRERRNGKLPGVKLMEVDVDRLLPPRLWMEVEGRLHVELGLGFARSWILVGLGSARMSRVRWLRSRGTGSLLSRSACDPP